MISDTILSGLTNLFALFGATKSVDVRYSKTTLKNYLSRHFGIRDVHIYLGLYEELRDLYSISPDLDKENIVEGICTNISSQLQSEEQVLILLRLMEFCCPVNTHIDRDEAIFRHVARHFNIREDVYNDFCDFIEDIESEHVSIQRFDNLAGHITVLWLQSYNKLVFTYHGRETVLLDDVPVLHGIYQTWSQSGILKVKKSGQRIYYSTAFQAYTKEGEHSNIEFCGRNINFRFPGSDNGMHNLSFNLHSGTLLAIMGGSGTGKTTLMSLLNGSLKPQQGSITINGHDINEPEANALIGYVPQDDLLIEELTVYQNLLFTAKLCFEGMSADAINKRVNDILKQLGLYPVKDLKVGSPLEKYISGGQRKRLNIALELIREPAVLFLDEPTSGLSSSDTEMVVNLLKEQTYKGKLIVVNIHQPSSDVYKLFDRLWLLDKGGYPVFDGNPIEAVTYFKTAANYADADSSTCPTCGNVNPEVVLNIIDEKALDGSGQISDERKVTPQGWHKMYLDNQPEHEVPKRTDVPKTRQKKPGLLKQFFIFLHRNIRTKITNLQYILITLIEAPALAAICAMLTHYAPSTGYTLMENKNLVSYMFMAVIVSIFIGMNGSAEEIIKDRAILKREKFLSLSYSSYISSKIFFMAIVVLLQTLLFVLVGNSIMELTDIFFVWWGMLFLVAFLSGLTGLLLSQCLNTVVAIYITIPILLIPQILLCGLVVNFSDLTPESETGNVPVIGNVIPSRWAFETIAVSQFAENEYERPLFDIHKKKYELQFYKMAYLYEIQSQLETMEYERTNRDSIKPDRMAIIKTCLPTITSICKMKPYTGDYSYSSLHTYTNEADSILRTWGNSASLEEDKIVTRIINKIGNEEYIKLKHDHYNKQLENFVINADTKHTHDIVNSHIVPRVGFIYIKPRTDFGQAPFYSSTKVILGKEIPTKEFNIYVLLLMCIILASLLYGDCPGRFMRKEE